MKHKLQHNCSSFFPHNTHTQTTKWVIWFVFKMFRSISQKFTYKRLLKKLFALALHHKTSPQNTSITLFILSSQKTYCYISKSVVLTKKCKENTLKHQKLGENMTTMAFFHLLLFFTRSLKARSFHNSSGRLLNCVFLHQLWTYRVGYLRLYALG